MIVEQDEGISANEPTNEDKSNAECSISGIILVPKKGTKSKVRRHFGLEQKDGIVVDMEKPVRRQCLLKVSAKRGNTSNLFAHLKTKNPDMYVEVQKLHVVQEGKQV